MRVRAIWVTLLASCLAGAAAAQPATWRVLVLHGTDSLFPSVVVEDSSMRAAFANRSPRPVEFFTESLDLIRFSGPEVEAPVVDFLRWKYEHRHLDLVIAVGFLALDFASRNRDRAWPGVPILFSNVPDDALTGHPLPPKTTGLLTHFDVDGTLDAAEKLQPNARRIVVVGGVAGVDTSGIRRITDVIQKRSHRLPVTVLSGATLAQLLDGLRKTPPDSIVFLASVFQDAEGRTYNPREVATRLSEAANSPVYAMSESCLGYGIVGGYMTSLEEHGEETAILALRVLGGEKPEAIPIGVPVPHVLRIDDRQLKRFRLDSGRLPPTADVRFRRPTLWQHFRGFVIAVTMALAILVGLVAGLLVHRSKRRRAGRALEERVRFERLVADLSAKLIDVPPERANEEVERALRRVMQGTGLDICCLFVISRREGWTRVPLQVEAAGIEPIARTWSQAQAPVVFRLLAEGRIVALADVGRELAQEATEERAISHRMGLKSALLIPVTVSEDIVRGAAFLTVRRRRDWPSELISRLRLVGDLVTSTIVGKRAEAALRASEEKYREVVESQTDLICRYLPDTTLTFVNEAYCRFFGRKREELIGRRFLELIPEGVPRETAVRHVESLIENPRVVEDEHEVLRPDGTIGWQKWIDHVVRGRDGSVVEFQAIGRDITDRKRVEEASRNLARAARLSLLGELTASIAHEINQPLGAILSNADAAEILLEAGPDRIPEVRAILSDIRREDLRASEVIHHIRSLLRRKPMAAEPLDVNELASGVLRFVGGEAERRGVSLETELEADLPAVRGDRVWLEQVLVNLLVNGMEATGAAPEGGRRLRLSTCRNGAGTVEVAVTDTGHGIPAHLQPRLFESFVTTREDGMGLGLSISRSIVEAHGGRIQAENNPEGGATFRFTLPATEFAAAGPGGAEAS